MAVDGNGSEPPSPPPLLPPVGRVRPGDPTVRVRRADGASPRAPFTPVLRGAPVVSTGRTITRRLAEAAATARRYEPPAPLTNPLRHPQRWIAVTAFSLVAAVVFAHLAALLINGLYYLVFEVSSGATSWWHCVIPDAALRHTARDAAEGFYGGAIAQQLIWNPFHARRLRYLARPMNWLDRLEDRLRIPNLRSSRRLSFWQIPCALAIWAPIYGSVGFTAAYLLDSVIRRDIALAQHTLLALGPHASMWQRTASMDTADWDKKVIGLAASFFFGRRPLRKVFDGIQLWLAERHVLAGRPMRWYYPPTFRARCGQVSADVSAGARVAPQARGGLPPILALVALGSAAALIAVGCYALTFAAG